MSETKLAGPMAVGTGEGNSKAVRASEYSLPSISATALAELYVRRRFRVSGPLARAIVVLAGLGNVMEAA